MLTHALPASLQKAVGLKQCMERVPEPYLRAMFSSHLASHFVYANGTESDQLAFFTFLTDLLRKAKK